jgi:hypothetical protein
VQHHPLLIVRTHRLRMGLHLVGAMFKLAAIIFVYIVLRLALGLLSMSSKA